MMASLSINNPNWASWGQNSTARIVSIQSGTNMSSMRDIKRSQANWIQKDKHCSGRSQVVHSHKLYLVYWGMIDGLIFITTPWINCHSLKWATFHRALNSRFLLLSIRKSIHLFQLTLKKNFYFPSISPLKKCLDLQQLQQH